MGGISSEHRIHGWKGQGLHTHPLARGLSHGQKINAHTAISGLMYAPLSILEFKGKKWAYSRMSAGDAEDAQGYVLKRRYICRRTTNIFKRPCRRRWRCPFTFKKKKVVYINFLLWDIQPDMGDCMPVADVPLFQDQGILSYPMIWLQLSRHQWIF